VRQTETQVSEVLLKILAAARTGMHGKSRGLVQDQDETVTEEQAGKKLGRRHREVEMPACACAVNSC